MNNQQRNRVPIYRDLNALGIVKKDLYIALIFRGGFRINNFLFFRDRPGLSLRALKNEFVR